MSKVKIPVSDRPKHFELTQVPDVLGSNFYGFERLKLLNSSGLIAVRYKNAGSILVGNAAERELKTYKNTSNIVIWEISAPCIYSVHENDSLQILNYETGTCDTVTFSSKATSLKKTQAILVYETTVFCVTAQTVLVWDRNNLKAAPKEIMLSDAKDKSTRPIINVNHNYSSALSTNRLLLGNNDVIQVWNVDKDKQEMYLDFEARNASSTIKNLNSWNYGNTVVTFNREATNVWNLIKPKEKEKNPKEIKEENIFTETYIDDSLIITGDNLGGLCLRQNDGDKLYDIAEPTGTNSVKKDAIEFNLDNKVNVITKLGRWVFVAFNNSKISVFDLFREKSAPVLEYVSPKAGSVNSLLVEGNTLLATFKQTSAKATNDKSAAAKEKPEVISWAPKLPGLDYYLDANKGGKDSIICVVAYTRRQISSYLEGIKNAGEEITELSTTTDHLGDCIDQIYKVPEFAVQFFQAIRKLQTSLDSFESLLEKLNQSGRLVRIFTSSRLRRDIEYQNSVVGNNVMDLEVRLKTAIERRRPQAAAATTPITKPAGPDALLPIKMITERTSSMSLPARESMITDPAGREFWTSNWGNALHVPMNSFLSSLRGLFPTITLQQERQVQQILDFANTESVSQYKFAEFLKGFGPFESCVTNVSKILSETWFHGFLSGRESELLMKNQCEPDGTFLVRFSKSKPGSFALAFLKDGVVNHILIESCMPEGYKILTQDSIASARMFKSLYELIAHYNYVLQIPMICDIPTADWFHGDITTDEANELLRDKGAGTFLVRFSSKGTFAASFVDSGRIVRHVLINTEGKNHYLVDTGSGLVAFKSIRELVNFYHEKQVFVHALVSGK